MPNIKLSPKHGVNPSICRCYWCGETTNTLVLAGRMKDDAKAPMYAIWDKEPCDKCRERMKTGVILVGVVEAKSRPGEEPFRSGHYLVVSDDWIRRSITPQALMESVLEKRLCYTSEEVCKALMNAEAERKRQAGELG